jgi:hypothetical protein
MSPELFELSMDQISKAPPAPPAPPTTSSGAPSSLFDEIKKGKSLKHTETVIKDGSIKGVIKDNTGASSSKVTLDADKTPTLKDALSAKFNKFNKAISLDDDDYFVEKV